MNKVDTRQHSDAIILALVLTRRSSFSERRKEFLWKIVLFRSRIRADKIKAKRDGTLNHRRVATFFHFRWTSKIDFYLFCGEKLFSSWLTETRQSLTKWRKMFYPFDGDRFEINRHRTTFNVRVFSAVVQQSAKFGTAHFWGSMTNNEKKRINDIAFAWKIRNDETKKKRSKLNEPLPFGPIIQVKCWKIIEFSFVFGWILVSLLRQIDLIEFDRRTIWNYLFRFYLSLNDILELKELECVQAAPAVPKFRHRFLEKAKKENSKKAKKTRKRKTFFRRFVRIRWIRHFRFCFSLEESIVTFRISNRKKISSNNEQSANFNAQKWTNVNDPPIGGDGAVGDIPTSIHGENLVQRPIESRRNFLFSNFNLKTSPKWFFREF